MQDWIEIERRVLSALCQGVGSEEARRGLAGYRWREPLHQALFATLAEIPSRNPAIIHDQLPARLTRRGFPDVDLEGFFQPSHFGPEEIETLIRRLQNPQ